MKLFLFFWICIGAWTEELDLFPRVYSEIADLFHPSIADLQKIQFYLTHGTRPIIERLGDSEFILRNFKLIRFSPDKIPEFGHLAIRSSEEDRDRCIILYASFNRNYPAGVRRLLNRIPKSGYRGHLYYRIGGWPNIEGGDLVLAHVPFAFKVCFFREMQRLGYKRVLWLDASILPHTSLNYIFNLIERDGLFVQANTHFVGRFMNEDTAKSFGLTVQQTETILSCSAAIIGIDFTNEKTAPLIELLYQAAKDPYAFFSPRADQTAFSILLHQRGLSHLMTPANTLGALDNIQKQTLFLMDRGYVKTHEDNHD